MPVSLKPSEWKHDCTNPISVQYFVYKMSPQIRSPRKHSNAQGTAYNVSLKLSADNARMTADYNNLVKSLNTKSVEGDSNGKCLEWIGKVLKRLFEGGKDLTYLKEKMGVYFDILRVICGDSGMDKELWATNATLQFISSEFKSLGAILSSCKPELQANKTFVTNIKYDDEIL